eukprot:1159019-Pelagomonas_calceolata.AAC.4
MVGCSRGFRGEKAKHDGGQGQSTAGRWEIMAQIERQTANSLRQARKMVSAYEIRAACTSTAQVFNLTSIVTTISDAQGGRQS